MRHGLTTAAFAAFFAAVGFTGRILWEVAGESEPAPNASRVRASDAGPYLHTVDRLADELELSPDQRHALQSLIDRTAERMGQCQEEQRAVVLESRRAVTELLRPDQNDHLEQILDDYWTKFRERRIAAVHELCAGEFGLCELETARITSAFRRYEEEKGEYLRRTRTDGDLDPRDRECSLRRLRGEFEQRMEGVLVPAQQERLWQHADSVSHRDCQDERSGCDAQRESGDSAPAAESCESASLGPRS